MFHYGITSIDSLTCVNTEILENMELTDPELQQVILNACILAAQGDIKTLAA